MDEPNPNQDRRHSHRPHTGERQSVHSGSQTHRREHDRHRRRRDAFRPQLGQTIQPVPTSAAYSPVSLIPGRLRDRSEDETIGNDAVMPSLSFAPTSPVRRVDDVPEGEIMENLPLVPSPMSVPNGADFCPPSPILSREDLEETTPIQSSDQTSQPNAIESQDVPPTLSSHTVISPVRQPLPTIATRDCNPDINRMEQILGATNRLRGAPFPGGYTEFNKYTLWGSQLAGSFNYEAIIQNVKGILSHVDPQRATMVLGKHIQNPTISQDIYRLLPKTNPGMTRTTASMFSEAFRL
jgi:hypothetical protein